ncbi:hypothetical protein JCM19037_1383 [Geomicrobium sp. JCM 19037]|uniref:hypothetical protein n=1 Tax=Geomicrobium sp. JCM 19037 TaxID=1460634 RepID=UPI00045F3527|nr:hypothetical protein [Geomicrobium sp. JCM 19037]GAK03095.1 hypothetical protein JCM19037_1383 [Geomicrobium sp. JCM 19037]
MNIETEYPYEGQEFNYEEEDVRQFGHGHGHGHGGGGHHHHHHHHGPPRPPRPGYGFGGGFIPGLIVGGIAGNTFGGPGITLHIHPLTHRTIRRIIRIKYSAHAPIGACAYLLYIE